MTPEQLADQAANIGDLFDDQIEALGPELAYELRRLAAIEAAAKKLIAAKGRYHTEQNYRALEALIKETP